MRKSIVPILALCLSVVFLSGCGLGVLAAGVGTAVGMGRSGKAKIIEAKSKYTEQYNNYKLGMERINLDREIAQLAPKPVMTFEEWLDTQPLSPDEIKLFKKYKATTTKDLKEQEKATSDKN
mgnify:CR=1 FL=1|tara:strand:- start:113 stop:478 length:366 start_codon:yes stop_codon:yes gene_type:complete